MSVHHHYRRWIVKVKPFGIGHPYIPEITLEPRFWAAEEWHEMENRSRSYLTRTW